LKDIIFDHVLKAYGKNVVVKGLNLNICEGERLVLLGPSGCGKTTTLRMIAGLENITDGQLYMGGRIVNDIPSGKRNVSMVFQNYALFPHMTVEDNISYGLKVQKVDPREIEERSNAAISMLDLNGLEKRKPKELSGGQRQRVALARALVKRSDYFLLDEPLSNLDAQLRVHSRKELVKIHEMYHQTFVYVTHDQVEAMTMGHRIALMYDGILQTIDTPSNVYNRPANVYAARFIGAPSTNIIEANLNEGKLIMAGQHIVPPEVWIKKMKENGGDMFYFGIRPEHTKITTDYMDNALKGIVRYTEDYGNKVGVYFDINGKELISVCDNNVPATGERVYFVPDYSRIHLFDYKTENSIGYPEDLSKHNYGVVYELRGRLAGDRKFKAE
jgi:sn-glycerol 3-phosphate transport system ATP-binding protein